MKKLVLLFTLIPLLSWAFPVRTNSYTFDPAQSSGSFDDFLFRWSGFDDQAAEFLFKDVTVSNVGFRLAYPQRGRTFLDVLPPKTTNTSVIVTNEVLDVYTNFYPAIFNKFTTLGYTNLTITENYSNNVFVSRSTVTNSSLAGSVANGSQTLPAANIIYTQNAAVVNTEAYGLFTNTYTSASNTTVTVRNNLEQPSVSIIKNGTNYYATTFDAPIINSFASRLTRLSGGTSTSVSQTATSALPVSVGSLYVYKQGVVSSISYSGSSFNATIQARFQINDGTNVLYSQSYFFPSAGNFQISELFERKTTNDLVFSNSVRFISVEGSATFDLAFSNAAFYIASTNNPRQSISTASVAVANSGLVTNEYAFPSTQRVSKIYSKTETPYSKVTFSVPRTNIPPDGPYFAEVLTYTAGGITNPSQSRTLAKGQVTIENSIYSITNYAGYTNYPGPWSYLLLDGSRSMSGNLDMGGNAVTNIGTNGLRFASGAYITPTDVATWNSFISSTSGLNAGTVFGGDVTGTYNNLTLRKNALDNMEFVDFTTAPTGTTLAGRMVWNTSRETVRLGLDADLNLDVGQQLILYARNEETNTLAKGEVVYIAGAQGDNPTIKRASNASESLSARTIGIMAESVAVNGSGSVVTRGTVYGLNTTNFTQGANLYLGVNGTLQTNLPVAPTHGVFIGVVERVSANAGQIYVAIQNYQELEELSDVNVRGVATNDFIIWNGTVWTNYARTNLNNIYLPLAGGTMSGSLNMGGESINDVAGIVAPSGKEIDMDAGAFDGGIWSFASQPSIPGYLTSTGAASSYFPITGGTVSGSVTVGAANGVSIDNSGVQFYDGSGRIEFDGLEINGAWTFLSQPTIPGYVNTNNLSTIAGSGLGVSGNKLIVTNVPGSFITISQANTNYWRITTAPTNATESGQRGQIAVSSSNVFIYNPDALGTGTGRWIRIQGSISWP